MSGWTPALERRTRLPQQLPDTHAEAPGDPLPAAAAPAPHLRHDDADGGPHAGLVRDAAGPLGGDVPAHLLEVDRRGPGRPRDGGPGELAIFPSSYLRQRKRRLSA